MVFPQNVNAALTSCALEAVWLVRVELAERDDARVREAVTRATGLVYGKYRGVAFETAVGVQFFEPAEGSRLGDGHGAVAMPARVLSFSLPCDPAVLAAALEAVREYHSYEEPVIMVTESYASRAEDDKNRDNPHRWWNRGFAE